MVRIGSFGNFFVGVRLRTALLALSLSLFGCGGSGDGAPDGGRDGGPPPSGPCEVDADCDDGVFCNGAELCRPESGAADGRGCVSPGSACMPLQTCDEAGRECVTDCAIDPDADGDGSDATVCGGSDCDDADARRYPGAVEVCDAAGLDEDCDPATLASGPTLDADGDTFVSDACCNLQADGELLCGLDCDDGTLGGEINPGATEVCNGEDEDCDGMIDEGVLGGSFYPDCDGDGFGRSEGMSAGSGSCAPPSDVPDVCPEGSAALWVTNARDCDDDDDEVKPGASERCNGKDDDCDGELSEAEDNDRDGEGQLMCGGTDCDDSDASVGGCDLAGARTFVWAYEWGELGAAGTDGTVLGFDLDGRVSTGTDAAGCNKADQRSPWGEEGVDLQLTPEAMIEASGPDLIRTGAGETVIVELSEVDGCDDPDATLALYRGFRQSTGAAILGETVSVAGPATTSISVRLEGGVLRANDVAYSLPFAPFDGEVTGGEVRGACITPDRFGQLVMGAFRPIAPLAAFFEARDPSIGDMLRDFADGSVTRFACNEAISEGWTFRFSRVTRGADACRFADCDGDGYGTFAETRASCSAPTGAPTSCPSGGWADLAGDCDDGDANRHPGAPELCDSVDDDCDGYLGAPWEERDADGDGADSVVCGGTDCAPYNPDVITCPVDYECVLMEEGMDPMCVMVM